MFEKMENQRPEIYLSGGEPIEFTYKGQRYRIYALLNSWRESGVGGIELAMAYFAQMMVDGFYGA